MISSMHTFSTEVSKSSLTFEKIIICIWSHAVCISAKMLLIKMANVRQGGREETIVDLFWCWTGRECTSKNNEIIISRF